MADRALRGMTIGAKSMESEEGVEFAERITVTYECPLGHTTTMESCAEDLDRLLGARRPSANGNGVADRQAAVESERAKLAEKMRHKTAQAKVLREARTGELAPITAEIINDGAGDL